MADQTLDQINETLEMLNSQLGDLTPFKLAVVDPKQIKHVEKNAHFMPKPVFDQISNNIKKDGNLASLPFCWKDGRGKFTSLSGNHRRDAAVAAEIPGILVLYTDKKMSKSEKLAVQLSHNSLVGADNPTVLKELWNDIDDLHLKIYSGLDEEFLENIEDVELFSPKDEYLRFQEMTLLFVPPEADFIEEIVDKLKRASTRRLVADLKLWDKFFDTLLEFKEVAGVLNTSTAFALMIQIADDWIDEHNKDEQEDE